MDTSALVAIVRGEEEAKAFNEAMATGSVIVGTPTLLEVSMVLQSLVGDEATDRFLQRFIDDPLVERVPFTFEMFEAAKSAFQRYGKGRHPAKLNFGDCMSYALARVRGVPLLYKGDDFARTDIRPALAS